MKIKEAVFKECGACHARHRVSDVEYGCDECRTPIDYGGRQRQYLTVRVFRNNKETQEQQFCSWNCALKGLKKVKSDYFVDLPYLHYDTRQKGIRAADFFAAIKAFK